MIVCHEILHSLKITKAWRGGMVLKLDHEKAYDKMDWKLLEM